jgi:hypothetical protein
VASLLGDVDSGSATIATIPMKACRRSDGWWVSRTNGPDPHTVPPTLGYESHVVKDRPMQVLVLVRVAQVRRFCGSIWTKNRPRDIGYKTASQ